ncbi:aminodeoxychorismate/anthranilate synthase component II [Paenibacillus urinalis]|uniref:Aminodeoxychorismate/anthranilate synthase component II n=1 Tax=Paenibacillus urinalis TaxID=521520 RepID=A0AAX3MUB1_9BACL|nr:MULTISPECIES: aminodeoxychorismate/anthranilate synthase component II [Paenibacillus]WDH80983.1 aminodeoxychorismate/anthranilate synthase component II [Paenibacillus urinalis]WDH97035.1 aminodeoxychorismate/anthranilate synthase component II [Paenibacillus urinalis]WDI00697.1 aminodeoxychorismate/anthranilate synthase component II [Paenibacillus urinalis]GAK39368.1 glutamine amidotransferase of anthranilate synthase [Paenibacillus sp. TCA20]
MLAIIDNFDSFTYNLVQYLSELGQEVNVYRNDSITLNALESLNPDYIVISPGPSNPSNAGISLEVIRYFAGKVPILGVCLGHQAIAQAFGAEVMAADQPMHGKTSLIHHESKGLFHDLPNPLTVARYHSLIVHNDVPDDIEVTATSEAGEIMALRHRKYDIEGVQFHPESIITPYGKQILNNFLYMYAVKKRAAELKYV